MTRTSTDAGASPGRSHVRSRASCKQPLLRARSEIGDVVEEQRPALGPADAAADAVRDVAAPSSNPNNWASTSASSMDEQLTVMNGPADRVDAAWIARAARVFPTPSSPCRHTLCADGATWAIKSQTRRIARLLPARSASR